MNREDNSILLVEDNQKHREDAIRVLNRYGIDYDLASNLADALGFFRECDNDGIISDVFFPFYETGVERPSGVILCEYALERHKPIVLCTGTSRYGTKTSQVYNYAKIKGVPLVESRYMNSDEEAEEKNWEDAVLQLLIEQAIMENSEFSGQRKRLNELVVEGDVCKEMYNHPAYSPCEQIAETVIQTIKREYPIFPAHSIGFGVGAVMCSILLKLPNYAKNYRSQQCNIDFVVSEEK